MLRTSGPVKGSSVRPVKGSFDEICGNADIATSINQGGNNCVPISPSGEAEETRIARDSRSRAFWVQRFGLDVESLHVSRLRYCSS
jgi:hypothetical protein